MPYNVFSKKNTGLRSEQEEAIEQGMQQVSIEIVDAPERDAP